MSDPYTWRMLEGRERDRAVSISMANATYERHKVFTDTCRFNEERSANWSKSNSATPSSSSTYSSDYDYDHDREILPFYLCRNTFCGFFLWGLIGYFSGWGDSSNMWVAFIAITFAMTGFVPSIILCIAQPPGFPPDTIIKSRKKRLCITITTMLFAIVGFGLGIAYQLRWKWM